MTVGIMQPYFLPYIGYFQLINAVDTFVIYDNIQYTKKGWINRNRMLQNNTDDIFTLPIKKDSDYLNIDQRFVADDFNALKLCNKIKTLYKRADYFENTFELMNEILDYNDKNLFEYILHSIHVLVKYLDIKTKIIVSSTIDIDHTLTGQDKVIAICKELKASDYINSIGGVELYSKDTFLENNIKLGFIKSKEIVYEQFNNEFVPWLSILDILMFNDKDKIKSMLTNYEVI